MSLQSEFGREVPLFEVEASAVETEFHRLYSYLFDLESRGYSVEEMDRPWPNAIFIVNFDKVFCSHGGMNMLGLNYINIAESEVPVVFQ